MRFSAFILSAALLVAPAMATDFDFGDSCDVHLKLDVSVNPEQMQVRDGGESLYRIDGEQLFIRGEEITLDRQQRALLQDFHREVNTQVPELMNLVGDGLFIAGEALDVVFAELEEYGVDPNLGSELMARINEQVARAMAADDNTYQLNALAMEGLGQHFDEELEQQIEQAISQSMGSLLMALGDAMMNAETGELGEEMNQFAERMENMGQEIETRVEARAQELERRAETLCDQWRALDQLENQVQRAIPRLGEFDLVVQGDPDLAWIR